MLGLIEKTNDYTNFIINKCSKVSIPKVSSSGKYIQQTSDTVTVFGQRVCMSVGLSVCMSYHKYHFCKEPNVMAKIIQFISTKSLNELETNHEKPASSMATTMMETTHGPTSSMITVMGATTWQQRPCKCFHWLMPSTHVLRLAHNVTHLCTIIVRVRAMVYTLSYNCTNDPVSEATKSIQNELYSSSNYG